MNILDKIFLLLLSCCLFTSLNGCGGDDGKNPQQGDTEPNAFYFQIQHDVERAIIIESNSVIVEGIDAPAPVHVEYGEYAIDDAAFTAAGGTIENGQSLRLRHQSAATYATSKSTTITVGGFSSAFQTLTDKNNGEASDQDNDGVQDLYDNAPTSALSQSAPQWDQPALPYRPFYPAILGFYERDSWFDSGRDGDLDLASWNETADPSVFELFQTEHFLFEENVLSHDGFSEFPFTYFHSGVYDLDGDGLADRIGINGNNEIIWYRNIGGVPHDFERVVIGTSERAVELHAADVDGDGYLDLLPGGENALSLFWYKQHRTDGKTQFTYRLIDENLRPTKTPLLADMNGDHVKDIFVPANFGATWYLMGKSTENKRTVVLSEQVEQMEAGDLDGDGDGDILWYGASSDTLYWQEQLLDGEFIEHKIMLASDSFNSIHLFDKDDDGDLDILYALNREFGILENDGAVPPHFIALPQAPDLEVPKTVIDDAYSLDIDNDNNRELVLIRGASILRNSVVILTEDKPVSMVANQGQSSLRFTAHDADGNELTYSIIPTETTPVGLFQMRPDTGELLINADALENSGMTSADNLLIPLTILASDGFSTIARKVSIEFYSNDEDDDNDGVPDLEDDFPLDPKESIDLDRDGLGNNADTDDDGDGVEDALDNAPQRSGHYSAPMWMGETFKQQTISQIEDKIQSAKVADMDGDGDLDVVAITRVSVSNTRYAVAWFENDGSTKVGMKRHLLPQISLTPRELILTDLDNDGDMDIVLARFTSLWYENNGESTPGFTAHNLDSEGTNANHWQSVDIDGDGNLDLLSTLATPDGLLWYNNNGATPAGFLPRYISNIQNNVRPSAIRADDFDADGDTDLIVSIPGALFIYEQTGLNSLEFVPHYLGAQSAAQSIVIRDFNNDGRMDFALGSNDDEPLNWYQNHSAMSFEKQHIGLTDAANTNFSGGLIAKDFDSDGDVDMAAILNQSRILFMENDGQEQLHFVEHIVEVNNEKIQHLDAGDINGDGIMEFIISQSDSDTVLWQSLGSTHYLIREGESTTLVESAIDSDGDLLNYAITQDNNNLLNRGLRFNSGTGTLIVPALNLGSNNHYSLQLSASDGFSTVNHRLQFTLVKNDDDDDDDGVPDALDAYPLNPLESADSDTDGIANNADPDDDNDGTEDIEDNAPLSPLSSVAPQWMTAEQSNETTLITSTADGANELIPADIDGDGKMDFVAVHFYDDLVRWYRYTGTGPSGFVEYPIGSTGYPLGLTVRDIDEDGDMDVLTVSRTNDTISIFENNGSSTPSFTRHSVYSNLLDYATDLEVGDLNNDGHLDVVVSTLFGNALVVYVNDGQDTFSFSPQIILNDEYEVESIALEDLDKDGDLDILTAHHHPEVINWYENRPLNAATNELNFTQHTLVENLDHPSDLMLADLDGDNDLDLIFNDSTRRKYLFWYQNVGVQEPEFIFRRGPETTNEVNAITAVDLEGDGDLDVLLYSSGSIIQFENDGGITPTFAARLIGTPPVSLNYIQAGDFDQDGSLDIVGAGFGADSFVWANTAVQHFNVSVGEIQVGTVQASDGDNNTLSYSLEFGIDASLFSIDDAGNLRFILPAPPSSDAWDSNGDNVYHVWVTVSDGWSSYHRHITVSSQ